MRIPNILDPYIHIYIYTIYLHIIQKAMYFIHMVTNSLNITAATRNIAICMQEKSNDGGQKIKTLSFFLYIYKKPCN